ncbi:c-type cytochrome [Alkalihalobacterium elongatum]|uniref:c-type cytochrome n=1 Tax=Alkalihalobacterium elongatum TaxID=2675466 RepID=UPI001C1F916E|nr:cytochrome c [Alkalihalobacterium elongatum]
MKKFLMALTGASILVLGACGGGGDEAPADDPVEEAPAEEAGEETAEETTGATYDAQAAEATYKAKCMSCHGGNLEGGVGPALTDGAYTYDEIIHVLAEGVGPMQPGLVEGEEAENLAAWLVEQ